MDTLENRGHSQLVRLLFVDQQLVFHCEFGLAQKFVLMNRLGDVIECAESDRFCSSVIIRGTRRHDHLGIRQTLTASLQRDHTGIAT